MTRNSTCPKCGSPLVNGRLEGLCPKCVAPLAFDLETAPVALDSIEAASAPPRRLGDYDLIEEIARGGMGVVFRARQRSLNRVVAVKLLLAGQFASKPFLERFRAEAQTAARLQHPNIVPVYEVGEANGQPFFSMELVEGRNLAELVRDQPLSPQRAANYLNAIAEAVHYAHGFGILHRDLKPANVLIDGFDNPRVTDFGLAKQLQADSELTLTGQVLGSPNFAPPEQTSGRNEKISARSDVYALGAILYYLLTGRPPFQAATLTETVHQVESNEPVSPRVLNPAIPRDLETISLKCLEKEPAKRYTTAQELADELGRFLRDESIRARPIAAAEKLWRWCRRRPALAIMLGALLLVASAGVSGILWQWSRAERHAASETAQRLRAEDAVSMLELQRAEDLLEKDETMMGVAHLARIVRQQATNRIAAQRLLSALTQRNLALPVGSPLQHAKKVNYAEFSPDGRRVATASLDSTARIWDARSGEPLTSPMVHPAAVRVAYFSPDGLRLLTFADDFQARLWEVAGGLALGQPMSHSNQWIGTAEFSPDGRRVVAASDNTTVRVWDGFTGQPLSGPMKHQGMVRSTHFSSDGRWIVTACEDGTAQVWDAVTGQSVAKPFRHGAGVTGAEFSPDGKRVVTSTVDFTTCVWDATTGEPLTKPLLHAGQIDTAKFSPDGERIIVSLHNGLTRIFNARDWASLTRPMQHRSWTTFVEFGPEAQRVLSGSLDNTARLWDARNGEPLSVPMQHEGMVWSTRLSADGLFAVTASADGTARLWDVRLGAARGASISHREPLQAAEFSPDGKWIVTAAQDNTARIWDARSGQPRGPALQHANWVLVAQFSRDGDRVATASSDGTARIWDAHTGQPVSEWLRHGGDIVACLQFSPNGRWLATAGHNATVRLWNAHTGTPHGEPIQHRSRVTFVCFSPDSRLILSSDFREDQVQLRDVVSGQLLAETPAREGHAGYGEFSPDGHRVVTASADGTTRIWDAQTLRPLTEPMRHKDSVTCARFSRDGLLVVTASEDWTAQVWDAHTSRPVGEPMRHRGWARQAEFGPDGALVVTASDDGTARLWDARTGRPVSESFAHGGKVVAAHFSPDGRRVVTASKSGSAHIWEVPSVLPAHEEAEPHTGYAVRQSFGAFEDRVDQQRQRTSAAQDAVAQFPGLLADLAEAVIGKRVNAQGALEDVSPARLGELRQRVSALPRDTAFTRWLAWFLADRSTRTIAPSSPITVPEYVARRIEEQTLVAAREAVLLAPTNAPALAHLADMLLTSPDSNVPVVVAEARFLLRRAETLAPNNAVVQEYRRRIGGQMDQPPSR